MEKPEYTDLHKFLVSFGIIIISLSFGFLWLIASSPLDDIYLLDNYSKLVIRAQQLVTIKLTTYLFLCTNRFLISGFLVFIGLLLIFQGLKKWVPIQLLDDKKQKLEKETFIKNIEYLNKGEIIHVMDGELSVQKPIGMGGGGESTEEEQNVMFEIFHQEEIHRYVSIENAVIEKLLNIYNNNQVYLYYKLEDYFFDLFIESSTSTEENVIFELVMVRSDVELIKIEEIIGKTRQKSLVIKKYFYQKPKICILFVYEETNIPQIIASHIDDLNEKFNSDNIFLTLFRYSDFENFSNHEIKFRIQYGYNNDISKG